MRVPKHVSEIYRLRGNQITNEAKVYIYSTGKGTTHTLDEPHILEEIHSFLAKNA